MLVIAPGHHICSDKLLSEHLVVSRIRCKIAISFASSHRLLVLLLEPVHDVTFRVRAAQEIKKSHVGTAPLAFLVDLDNLGQTLVVRSWHSEIPLAPADRAATPLPEAPTEEYLHCARHSTTLQT